MPQLRHQGKFVFGWSVIKDDNKFCFPKETVEEYKLIEQSGLILFTSSKISGGFCITGIETLKNSKLSRIIENNPELETEESLGKIISYKGKSYCHIEMIDEKHIVLTEDIKNHFDLSIDDKLLIVRGSNIAFDCLVKGPLVEVANESSKQIDVF
ncbi:hypothetical protein SH1V18_00330 [Vallitalea longa]|uniref:Uncharacterized protein n=1 Tax=Vallitalea longa TaxID=2936439 RepID=A0A9W5YA65_9FIRM|nr:hypothetical protein [Vallitalea longa]GKX27553.1 hypothetical protein SH1V18_00330 [Vallitalea longa]